MSDVANLNNQYSTSSDIAINSCAEKLRDEIMAYEESQKEAGRWGIVGLSILVAIGMGLNPLNMDVTLENRVYILCAMTLFAPYCVLIRRKFDIRIAIISAYFCTLGDVFGAYEKFVHNDKGIQKTHWKIIPLLANLLPTIGACLLGIYYGNKIDSHLLFIYSFIGFCSICIIELYYHWANLKIRKAGDNNTKEQEFRYSPQK